MITPSSLTPTTSKTVLVMGSVGFSEMPARIVGNFLKLELQGLVVGDQYIVYTKPEKNNQVKAIEKQVFTATSSSQDINIALPLTAYSVGEDYFLSVEHLEVINNQSVATEGFQSKFVITERLGDGNADAIISQSLTTDLTVSGTAITTFNKVLDENAKAAAIDGGSTNNQWASASQIHDLFEKSKPTEFYDFVVGTSDSADYKYNGTDISVALNSAISDLGANGGSIFIEKGDYAILNTINLSGKSNIAIIGAGKKITNIVGASLDIIYFNLSDSGERFNGRIKDITLDNTSAVVGSTAILFNTHKDGFFNNITVRNFDTGYLLQDDTLYNSFLNVDTEDCRNDVVIKNVGDPSNSNNFFGCKLLSDKNLVNSGLGTHVPLRIEVGNHNTFIGCVFENFTTGIYNNGVGNSFSQNRIESNDITASTVYLEFGPDSKNNQYVSNYYSGNDWVNRAASIVDNGAGNTFIEGNTFKDQFMLFTRNILTAGDVTEFRRTGSGNDFPVITATDTFPNSGNPISYRASGVRPGHKFYQGLLSGVENYFVTGQGLGYFAAGINVNSQKVINLANPTSNTDATNKFYVDTEVTSLLNYVDSEITNLKDYVDTNFITLNTSQTITGAKTITASQTKVQVNGDSGSDTATGGSVLINNTDNRGSALTVYTNIGSASQGNLINIRSQNPGFTESSVMIDHSGSTHAVDILKRDTNDPASAAINAVSNNRFSPTIQAFGGQFDSAVSLITHIKPFGFNDIDGSGLTIEMQDSTSNADGLKVISESQGKLFSLRKGTTGSNTEVLKVDKDGKLSAEGMIIPTSYTPTGSADTAGQTGEIRWDDDYIYVKTSTGWKRSGLTTF